MVKPGRCELRRARRLRRVAGGLTSRYPIRWLLTAGRQRWAASVSLAVSSADGLWRRRRFGVAASVVPRCGLRTVPAAGESAFAVFRRVGRRSRAHSPNSIHHPKVTGHRRGRYRWPSPTATQADSKNAATDQPQPPVKGRPAGIQQPHALLPESFTETFAQGWPTMPTGRASSSRPVVQPRRRCRVRRRDRGGAAGRRGCPRTPRSAWSSRNRLPHAASIVGSSRRAATVSMIYSFESPEAIGRDIERLESRPSWPTTRTGPHA